MRRVFSFLLVMIMVASIFAIPAQAAGVTEVAEPRATTVARGLDITDSVATCTLRATGNSTSEYMFATIKLYRGGVCVASWAATGNGYIFFSQEKNVLPGYTYTLKINLTIDGETFPVPDVSKTY